MQPYGYMMSRQLGWRLLYRPHKLLLPTWIKYLNKPYSFIIPSKTSCRARRTTHLFAVPCCHQGLVSHGNWFPFKATTGSGVLMDTDFSFYFLPDMMSSTVYASMIFFPDLFFLLKPWSLEFDSLYSLWSSLMFIISFPHCSQAHLCHNFFLRASHSIFICVFSLVCIWMGGFFLCCLGSDRMN